MNLLANYFRDLVRSTQQGWTQFWFTPADPAALGLIRICAGAMLFYTHLVWGLDLEAFFGPQAWLTPEAVSEFQKTMSGPETVDFSWSIFWWIESPALLWAVHIAALVVFALLTVGLFTRAVSILAFLAAVSYVNRVPGALFGLDQINLLLALYLMVGPSGDAFSLDRWWRKRRGLAPSTSAASVGANLAIRLIQVHMCIVYLFAGLSKLTGASWWDGMALWLAFANLEYQSVDMTWIAQWPILINLLTHLTIFWEISYIALVWPRLTRPIMVFLAIPMHLGIGICMGMMTFGLVMLIANLAFVSPGLVRAMLTRRGIPASYETVPVEQQPKKQPRPRDTRTSKRQLLG